MALDTTVAKAAIDELAEQAEVAVATAVEEQAGKDQALMAEAVAAQRAVDQAEIDRLNAIIAELREGGERFPGDPGTSLIVGVAADDPSRVPDLERVSGHGCASRTYTTGSQGIGAFAVPNGHHAAQIKADHAAHRVPVISGKPGIEALAAHRFHDELVGFFRWTEAQPGITHAIFHHEMENDWPDDFGDMAAYAKHQADAREAQRWVRACLNEATGGTGGARRTVFAGCLMTYSWSAQGKGKFGDPNGWNPGRQADGSHTWDYCGLDHYAKAGNPVLNPTWVAAADTVKAWALPLGVHEHGVRQDDPAGPQKIVDLSSDVQARGGVVYLYYDSTHGAVDGGWVLTPASKAKVVALLQAGFNPNAA